MNASIMLEVRSNCTSNPSRSPYAVSLKLTLSHISNSLGVNENCRNKETSRIRRGVATSICWIQSPCTTYGLSSTLLAALYF